MPAGGRPPLEPAARRPGSAWDAFQLPPHASLPSRQEQSITCCSENLRVLPAAARARTQTQPACL